MNTKSSISNEPRVFLKPRRLDIQLTCYFQNRYNDEKCNGLIESEKYAYTKFEVTGAQNEPKSDQKSFLVGVRKFWENYVWVLQKRVTLPPSGNRGMLPLGV